MQEKLSTHKSTGTPMAMPLTSSSPLISNQMEEEEEEEKEVDNEKAEDEKPANALSKTMAVTVADFEIGLSKHSLKL